MKYRSAKFSKAIPRVPHSQDLNSAAQRAVQVSGIHITETSGLASYDMK